MGDERWQKLKQIFSEAVELQGKKRQDYLNNACGDNKKLKRDVLSLLKAYDQTGAIDRSIDEFRNSVFSEVESVDMTGRIIGSYKIIDNLGQGGMGSVFLAERADDQFDQQVALKLLKNGFISDNQTRRFLAERQILASLNHTNIATLLDGGVTEYGQPWFVMEYVEGLPICQYCDKHQLNIQKRLNIFLSVCEAVQFAHQKLVIHRDLKPSNILVNDNGQVKLLDFGISKVLTPNDVISINKPETVTGLFPLTPEYASPEQIKNEGVTTASDIYQLGIVLYELLTGYRPYEVEGRSPAEIERNICNELPTRPSAAITKLPAIRNHSEGTSHQISSRRNTSPERLTRQLKGDLDTIILKAMKNEPERRYDSAEQLGADIQLYLSGRPVLAYPDSWIYRSQKFIHRHTAGFTTAIAFLLLVIGYGFTITWQTHQTQQALVQANNEAAKARQVSDFLMGMFEAGDPAETLGDTVTARVLLDKGIKQAEMLDSQPEVQAEMLHVIGKVYSSLGEYDDALPVLMRSLQLHEQIYDSTDLATAQIHYQIGSVLHGMGDYHQSYNHYQNALSIFRKHPDSISPEYAASLHNVASVQSSHQDVQKFKSMHREALEINRQIFESDHPEIAVSLQHLGSSHLYEGESDTAIKYFQNALDILHKNSRSESPEAAEIFTGLGMGFEMNGEFEKAEENLQKAYSIREKIYGARHSLTAISLKDLGDFYRKRSDFTRADSLYNSVLTLINEEFGEQHPLRRPVLQNMGILYMQMDQPARAESYLRETLDLLKATLQPEHPRIATAQRRLASCLKLLHNYEEAEKLLDKSLQVYQSRNNNDKIIDTANELISLYKEWGKMEKVDEYENMIAQL